MKFLLNKNNKLVNKTIKTKVFELTFNTDINTTLNLSSIKVDYFIIPILKIQTNYYLINDFNINNYTEDFEREITDLDLLLIFSENGASQLGLQEVTDIGNSTINRMKINTSLGLTAVDIYNQNGGFIDFKTPLNANLYSQINYDGFYAYDDQNVCSISSNGIVISTSNNGFLGRILSNTLTDGEIFQLPNQSGILATQEWVKPYKEFVAIIHQTLTNAPTIVNVLVNDFPINDITFSYIDPGVYSVNSATNLFTINKTVVSINGNQQGYACGTNGVNDDPSTFSLITTLITSHNNADGGLQNAQISIKVYN